MSKYGRIDNVGFADAKNKIATGWVIFGGSGGGLAYSDPDNVRMCGYTIAQLERIVEVFEKGEVELPIHGPVDDD